MEQLSETSFPTFLRQTFGVHVERIPRSRVLGVRTADFRCRRQPGFVAELKELLYEPPSEAGGWTITKQTEHTTEAERMDNGPERVANKIHEAFGQLDGNVDPKVAFFLNHCPALDFMDLLEAYRGYLVYSSDTFSYANRSSAPIAEGRIREEKNGIDLYVWIDDWGPSDPAPNRAVEFLPTTECGKEVATTLFG